MPSWKKVVSSGSAASLSSLTVDTYVSASSFNGTYTGSLFGTASYAASASYILPLIQTVTITGSVNITGSQTINGYTQFQPVTTNINSSLSASYVYVSGSTQDLYFTQNGNGYSNTTRLRWIESNLYTGLLSGGVISSTLGSTTFSISSGSAIIVNLNASTGSADPYPTVQYVKWNNLSAPLTYSGSAKITYVGIDNTGNIVQQTVPWGTNNVSQWDTSVEIGVVLHLSGSVSTGVYNAPQVSYGFTQRTDDFLRAFGPLKISGHTLQASGSTLGLTKTAGTAYNDGANYVNNPNHPSTVSDPAINTSKIYRYYVSGSTPIIDTGIANAGYTFIDPTLYNNNGVLTTVPGSGANKQWSIQRVFWIPNSPTNAFIVYYGNATYASSIDAQNAIQTEVFTEAPNTAQNGILIGYIIVRKDCANLSDGTTAYITQGGLFRSINGIGNSNTPSISNTLAGLSDVAISGPTAGDLLVYGSGTQWNNAKVLTGSYSLTGSLYASAGFTGSLYGTSSYSVSASYAYTASSAISASYSYTASSAINASASLIATSASYAYTASSAINASASLIAVSASYAYTASSAISSSYSYTASSAINASASLTAVSASYALTASYLLGYISPFPFTGSAQITGSLGVTGSINTAGNITTTGTITAQTLVVSTISSSIEYSSGSNIFGNSTSNTQTMTGSVNITGSLNVVGNLVFTNSSSYVGNLAGYGANATSYSVFLGEQAGFNAAQSANATFLGSFAGFNNTSSSFTTAVGYGAGIYVTASGNSTMIGTYAGYSASYAVGSTFLGIYAGAAASASSYSTFVGPYAGYQLSGSSYSIALGYNAGFNNRIGNNNILIGTNVQLASGSVNSMNIGGLIFGSGSYFSSTNPSSGSANGKIGINQPNPQYALDISGSVNVSSSIGSTVFTANADTLVLTGSFFLTGSQNITGSLNVSNGVTASLFGTASQAISASYALTASYALNGGSGGGNYSGLFANFTQSSAATTWSFTHNLNTKTPLVQVYDTSYNQIIPQYISGSTVNTVILQFGIPTAGYAVATNGGGLYITGSTSTLVQATPATTWSFVHNLNNQYNTYQVYDTNNEVIVPYRIVATDLTSSVIYFASPIAGRAVAQYSGVNGTPNALSASYSTTASYVNPLNQNVLITGSLTLNQIPIINTDNPALIITGSISASANLAQGAYFAPTLVASASNDVLVGLDINPTFNTGSFTSIRAVGLRIQGILFGNGGVSSNILIGNSSTLYRNTSGNSNIAIGNAVLSNNGAASSNVAIGNSAGTNLTSNNNVIIGQSAAANSLTGNGSNVIIGTQAMFNGSGGNNVAIGYQANQNNTGNYNVGVGVSTISQGGNGSNNAAVGFNSMFNIANGSNNTAIGYQSGKYAGSGSSFGNTTSNNSIYIGYDVRPSANGNTNEIIIAGYNGISSSIGLGSNTTVIGNNATISSGIWGNLVIGGNLITGSATGSGYTMTIAAPAQSGSLYVSGSSSFTGSFAMTGSYTQNGYTILSYVSQSLNYADDVAAAAGGVPLGGLYRNGNFILIRLS
jgi:hypothetical protein